MNLLELETVMQSWRIKLTGSAFTVPYGAGSAESTEELTVVTYFLRESAVGGAPALIPISYKIFGGDPAFEVYWEEATSKIKVVAGSDTVTFSTVVSVDVLHKLLVTVDRVAGELKCYIDDVELAGSIAIATGAVVASAVYVEASLWIQTGVLQTFSTALPELNHANAGGAVPPPSLTGWAGPANPVVFNRHRDVIFSAGYDENFLRLTDFLTGLSSYTKFNLTTETTQAVEVLAGGGLSPAKTYISDGGFVSEPADSPASTPYPALLISIPMFTQTAPDGLFGVATEALNNVQLSNKNGELDWLLLATSVDQHFDYYIGDPDWPKSDFRKISGKILGISSGPNDALTLSLGGFTSVLQRSAAPDPNNPLAIGYTSNLTPGPGFKYAGKASTVSLATVYDKGIAVSKTNNTADRTFTLAAAPTGQVTYDTYAAGAGSLANALYLLLTEYGHIDDDELHADINLDSAADPNLGVGGTFHWRDMRGGVAAAAGGSETLLELADQICKAALCVLHSHADGTLHMTTIGGPGGPGDSLEPPGLPTPANLAASGEVVLVEQIRQRYSNTGEVFIHTDRNHTPLNDVADTVSGSSGFKHPFFSMGSATAAFTGETVVDPYLRPHDAGAALMINDYNDGDISTPVLSDYVARLLDLFGIQKNIYQVGLDFAPWTIEVGDFYTVAAANGTVNGLVVGKSVQPGGANNSLLIMAYKIER